ncbi:MAG: B12-binding domain-containing radical SAM protein [Spirochaetes bacterium]|nr:B12-binding domain-containing radical SAM protein [Spirochaetota bacterium]
MNVLLVYPEYPVTFWSFKHALKFINKKSNLPPLGILTVGAMLPKEWNLKLIDMNTRPLKNKDILWADFVFISAMLIQKESARSVVNRCKELGVKTVAGGPLFSTETECFDDVDHLLLYEGEVCIPQFLSDLKNNSPKHIYNWESYPEVTQTPTPAWKLLNIKQYAMLSIQYSRGCPFNCDFCNVVSLFGNKPRTKTAGQIIEELEAIYKLGWRGSIFFVDDNFIGNKKKLKEEVLPAIIEWMRERNYPFDFFTEVSINIADNEDLMRLMACAGFDNVFVGIETVDEDCLSECNKAQNTKRDLVESVRRIQRHGMQVQGGFILGFDNDKPSIFSKMISFIQESGIITAMVGLLNAPAGTKLFERMKQEERLLKNFSGTNTDVNFITKMNLDDLRAGYDNVVRTIYGYENYYRRIKVFLENYRPQKVVSRQLNFRDIKVFFKACFVLGVVSKGSKHYWGLLRWALSKKKGVFSLAVRFSVYGYHFRKCIAETGISR